ncbi:hypothetical protein [Flavobacterium daemonense]|uniref:hypothetical protein n=1 Tax=Flavobacterium daemonense TaxID=1393049 RepID=UPI001186E377|nr:hypothetical protein [Flavobacterium daemonense]KAF2337009.1 hypothetical protein FND99_00975 [Flavobacterium daemonense]
MKHWILTLVLFTFLISCNKKQELKSAHSSNDSVVVYNEEQFYKTKSKRIKVVDTVCPFSRKACKE